MCWASFSVLPKGKYEPFHILVILLSTSSFNLFSVFISSLVVDFVSLALSSCFIFSFLLSCILTYSPLLFLSQFFLSFPYFPFLSFLFVVYIFFIAVTFCVSFWPLFHLSFSLLLLLLLLLFNIPLLCPDPLKVILTVFLQTLSGKNVAVICAGCWESVPVAKDDPPPPTPPSRLTLVMMEVGGSPSP